MRRNLAQARTHESALEWLSGHDPDDGHGLVGAQALDASQMFTQPVVLAAFAAGADQVEASFTIERAVGQRQLDDAASLIMEAADLFVRYAAHHRDRAAEAVGTDQERVSLEKAQVNLLMAIRLKEWLAGSDTFSVSLPADCDRVELTRDQPGLECGEQRRVYTSRGDAHPFGDTRCGVEPFPIPAEIADNGDLVPVDTKRRPNIRPVTDGPMADPAMIESLVEALGGPAHSLSMAKAGAFKLQTPDPRFDPLKPVTVNGFLFNPATEARR